MVPMNETIEVLTPQETPQILADPVIPLPVMMKVSPDEAVEAAKRCGLDVVEVKNWPAYAKVGQYFQETGAIKISTTQFLRTNKLRRLTLQKCRSILRKTSDPTIVLAMAHEINSILDSTDQTTRDMLALVHKGQIKEPEPASGVNLPPKGKAVVAVQINNNVTGAQEQK